MNIKKAKTIKEYIKSLQKEPRKFIAEMTEIIKKNAPEAEECISYGMPAFKVFGRILVYYAAFSNHYSLFPGPGVIREFKDELTEYKTSKGTIKFSYEKQIPKTLIKKIIRYKVKYNINRANMLK
jgi:uncharacterized protein YdhG (YjbR/CyaY superfamily)